MSAFGTKRTWRSRSTMYRNERGARRLRSQQHLLLNAQGLEFFSVCIARIARCASQNPAAFRRPLRLWPFNHRKPFGRWKALTRNGSDPLNAPYPGRAGDKSNLKRQGHGIVMNLVVKAPRFGRRNRSLSTSERSPRVALVSMLCSYSYARRSANVIAGPVSVGCAVFAGCPLLTQSGHARPQIAASQLDPEPPISSVASP